MIEVQKFEMDGEIQPSTIDDATRTVDVIWYTGAKVARYNWMDGDYLLQLGMEEDQVDLSILNNGAPVCDSHSTYSVLNQLGVVRKAWVENGLGKATIQFSMRESLNDLWRDIKDKIVSKFSVRAELAEKRDITKAGEVLTYLATKWTATEISCVSLAADMATTTLKREDTQQPGQEAKLKGPVTPMEPIPGQVTAPDKNTPPPQSPEELKRKGAEEERLRAETIRQRTFAAGLTEEFAAPFVKDGSSLEVFTEKLFAKLAEKSEGSQEKTAHSARIGTDQAEKFRAQMQNHLLHRVDPSVHKLEAGREFFGNTLLDNAKECLNRAGVSYKGVSKLEIARLAFHSTSDFPAILADVANKRLRNAYEVSPKTYEPFTRQNNFTDFKPKTVAQFGDAPNLLPVGEGGEFKTGTIKDGKETYKLLTAGRVVNVSRQAIINDDLDAFSRLPALFGASAARYQSDIVWAIITSNPNMGDGIALFHATHGNLTASGTAISVASLGVGRAAMRVQKGLDNVEMLNLMPKFIMAPAALETVVDQYLTATQVVFAKSSDVNPFAAGGDTQLKKIIEPRLDANSAVSWYLAADPSQVDTIEWGYLDGQEGVFLEQEMGFLVDGMQLKCRLDFAAKGIDHRGLYKNVGA